MTNVVPFGKYKGQPIEAMALDRQYVEWLSAQPWFRERYQNVYTMIVNNFQEPTETPEHNKLQTLFLNDEFVFKMIQKIYKDYDETYYERQNAIISQIVTLFGKEPLGDKWLPHPELPEHQVRDIRKYGARLHDYKPVVEFESYGFDVLVSPCSKQTIGIEIKPTVGDDYPAVLRQITAAIQRTPGLGAVVLLVDNYTGVGATKEQFVSIFNKSRIRVVFFNEILV